MGKSLKNLNLWKFLEDPRWKGKPPKNLQELKLFRDKCEIKGYREAADWLSEVVSRLEYGLETEFSEKELVHE